MLELEVIQRVQMLPFAGVISDENRLDINYVRTLVNTARDTIIRDFYMKNNKRLNPQCYQKHWPKFDVNLQDEGATYVKFSCPQVITLDSNSDGFRYIGTIDCADAFRRIRNRSRLSDINKHPVMGVKSGRYTGALYDGGLEVMEIHGNPEIEELLIEAVFADPRAVPTYNPLHDQYPASDDLISMIEDFIFRNVTSIEASNKPEIRQQQFQQTSPGGRRR